MEISRAELIQVAGFLSAAVEDRYGIDTFDPDFWVGNMENAIVACVGIEGKGEISFDLD
jgi:hypothetical protein